MEKDVTFFRMNAEEFKYRTKQNLPPISLQKWPLLKKNAMNLSAWMKLIVEAGLMDEKRLVDLKAEAVEILSMVVASIKAARSHK